MPIFDFKCPQCGQVAELLVRSPEGAAPVCPSCGGDRLEKLPAAATMLRSHAPAATCCGREERCDSPPCSAGGGCCHG